MKKIYAYAAALAMVAGMTACGGSEEQKDGEKKDSTAQNDANAGNVDNVNAEAAPVGGVDPANCTEDAARAYVESLEAEYNAAVAANNQEQAQAIQNKALEFMNAYAKAQMPVATEEVSVEETEVATPAEAL